MTVRQRPPFEVLVRTFFAQFFTSETVSSDMRMRESMIFVLAFVITPCVFLIVSLFPQYSLLTLPVSHRFPVGTIVRWGEVRHRMAIDMSEWLVAVLVGYAMVAAGLVAVFVWDSLTFDRRDAMVLGPLPLSNRTVMLAKLSALVLFLLGAAIGLNLLNATVFALTMSLRPLEFVTNFVSVLIVTTTAATLVLSIIVAIRSALGLVGGARSASAIGSILQFLFIATLLVFLASFIAPPTRPGRLSFETTLSPPIVWFAAWFEVLRGSDRGTWDGFVALSRYAVVAVPSAFALALLTSVAAHRRQMQIALTGVSSSDFRRARFSRAIARLSAPGDRLAPAVSDFILTTIARNPAQRAPIAINAAIGLGMIVISLTRTRGDGTDTLLAMPLMAAFWTAIGVRASFFVPSQLPAAWTFFVNAPGASGQLPSYRAAARAAIVALVAPAATALAVVVGGWRHGAVTLLFVIAFAGFLALTIDFVPFTRSYRAGHARLRRRWPIYLIGAFACSYGIVALEGTAPDTTGLSWLLVSLTAVTIVCDVAGRWTSRTWKIGAPDDAADVDGDKTIVLGLDAAENRPLRGATS